MNNTKIILILNLQSVSMTGTLIKIKKSKTICITIDKKLQKLCRFKITSEGGVAYYNK